MNYFNLSTLLNKVNSYQLTNSCNEWFSLDFPSVYIFFDNEGVPLYVGETANFRQGINNYFKIERDGTWSLKSSHWQPARVTICDMSGASYEARLELRRFLNRVLPIPENLFNKKMIENE